MPLNVTSPAATARTIVPPGVPYSSPRLPAHHAQGGGRNGSTTGASTGGSQQASAAAVPAISNDDSADNMTSTYRVHLDEHGA